jgi:hypothetical protein
MKINRLYLFILFLRNFLFDRVLGKVSYLAKRLLFLSIISGYVLSPKAAFASNRAAQDTPQTFTLEIRYENPAAGQVALVWGVNGWQSLPDASRPADTELRNGIMYTPMTGEGESFTIRIQLPAWTTVDFGFLTTQDKEGNPVNIWESDGEKDFQTVTAETDSVIEIKTAQPLSGTTGISEPSGELLANLNVRYTSPTSGEVFLVWGMNGWSLAPEEDRPPGTVIEGSVMHTPMLEEEGVFVANVQVAPGTVVDFGFLTTKDGRGEAVEVWEADGADDYHIPVTQDSIHDVQSQLALQTGRALPSIAIVGLYILIGLLVIVVVGFIFRRKSI